MVETAALDRVVDLARAVRRDDDDGRGLRDDRAEFGNRHLEIGQHLEQVGFERLVRAVEFVDQQHRGDAVVRIDRLQQRPLQQKAPREDVARQIVARDRARRLREPDLDHLARIVPFVHRRGRVETLVALQPNQRPMESGRQHLGDFRLADARLALEKERPLQS